MNPKNIIKKTMKKATSPLAKKVYNVADNVNNIKTEPLYKQLGSLQIEIERLKEQNSVLSAQNATLTTSLGDFESASHYVYYYHGGSGNHGCEALVRTISDICNIQNKDSGIYSYRPEQDRAFGILDKVNYVKKSYLDTKEMLDHYRSGTLALSIGGDNYCGYPIPQLAEYNRKFHTAGAKTALIGCSIEPSNLEHNEILGDLCQFDLITARESITYHALLNKGVNKNTHLIPDSAFVLQPQPSGIVLPNNTIGFNISSIISVEAGTSTIMKNSIEFISYILKETSYNIALIPHVNQDFNDDYAALKTLYEYFNKDSRLILIGTDFNACQLKDIISQCTMLIAARTHCSIAGYSMAVPTLVLGYSVKSKGIAKDIFGTSENYVKSVHDLKSSTEFVDAFLWLEKNQAKIKKHLKNFMPTYIKKAYGLKTAINTIPKNKTSFSLPKAFTAKPNHYKKGVLSIITSCYNSQPYLYRYLNSILNQTNHNIQLILINDGSTDQTERVIADYYPILTKQGIEVIYLKQQNVGIGGAYDTAIKYVSGEYFCWFDSDDIKTPDFANDIIKYFEKYPARHIVRFDAFFVPEEYGDKHDLLTMTNFKKFSSMSSNPNSRNLFLSSIFEKNWFFGNTIAFRTKKFDEVSDRNLFHSRIGQNWQLCLPMLYNFKSYYIPKVYNYIILRKDSVGRSNSSQNDFAALLKQYDEYNNILVHVLSSLKPKNLDYLLKAINQKYITIKLNVSKAHNNQECINKYTKLYEKEVAPNNLYQEILDQID